METRILIIDGRLTNAIDLCVKASAGLRRKAAGPSVVFVAAPEDDNWAIDALLAGARGILGKRAAPGDLHKALRAVVEGEIWSSRRILTASLERLISPAAPSPAPAPATGSPRSTNVGCRRGAVRASSAAWQKPSNSGCFAIRLVRACSAIAGALSRPSFTSRCTKALPSSR